MKSQVLINALANPAYRPFCLRCTGLVRMGIVEPFYWRCACGAEHDERYNVPKTEIRIGLRPRGGESLNLTAIFRAGYDDADFHKKVREWVELNYPGAYVYGYCEKVD